MPSIRQTAFVRQTLTVWLLSAFVPGDDLFKPTTRTKAVLCSLEQSVVRRRGQFLHQEPLVQVELIPALQAGITASRTSIC